MAGLFRKARKALHIARDGQMRRGLFCGVAAAIEHEAPMAALAPDLVLDVGANRGQFSLLIRALHPTCRILAFEPLQTESAVYSRVFASDPLTVLVKAAVGVEPGTAEIHRSASADCSSLLPISKRQTEIFPGTEEISTETIDVTTLNDSAGGELERDGNALLKIDVQGFERTVLESAAPLLAQIRWVYVEASFVELYEGQALADEILAYLQNHGFALKGIYNPAVDTHGLTVQADFLFERRPG